MSMEEEIGADDKGGARRLGLGLVLVEGGEEEVARGNWDSWEIASPA